MVRRPLIGIMLAAAACTTLGSREPTVRVRVVNGARYSMVVRTCPPGPCSDFRVLRPGARTTFVFPWRGMSRHMVEGRDGDRVAIQVPVDLHGPGAQTVTLIPRYHPQQSVH